MCKMRVLHLLSSDIFSGAENVVCQIVGMFKETHDINMAYCSRDGQIREALNERDIDFYPIRKMNVSEVKRVIREYSPDIIHAHDMRAGFTAAIACGKIPLISHIHNNSFASRGISLKSIAYLLAAKKAKHIFWVSQSSFDGYLFHSLFAEKSTVLYNIIDTEALKQKMLLDKNSYNYDIIFLGRLTYPKNPQRLIGIFGKIIKIRPETKLAVVGTGELDAEIRQLAANMGLSDKIKFLGFQSNPYKMLYDAKVMLMTSRWEGTPMCALEAMALGVPIVSTPTDGLKNLISSGQNGFLSTDDNELAEKIVEILNSREIRGEYSKNAYAASLKQNDKQLYKAKLTDIYNKAINN